MYNVGTVARLKRTVLGILLRGALSILFPLALARGGSLQANWDATPDAGNFTYNVYYGTASHSYQNEVLAGANLSAVISGLTDGRTYYVAVTAVDGAGLESDFSSEASFTLPGGNSPPTISSIADQSGVIGQTTAAIAFTISDPDSPASSLTLSANSSSTTLVPNANIVFGGSGQNRTVKLTPAAGQSGTTVITILVNDGTNTSSSSFNFTVQANPPPTISAIGAQSGTTGHAVGPISFTVSDVNTPASSLTVSGVSSATTLVPNANITFGGSGANRTVTVTPATGQTGTAQITVTVSDGVNTASSSFNVTIQATPPPTISLIGAQSGNVGKAVGPIAFTVGDANVALSSLTLSGASSATTLIPNANITFGGSGANRTVTLTPAAGQIGNAQITITVSDGLSNASTSFSVTIQTNPPPTITAIAPQTGKAGKAVGPISFTVGDASVPLSSLTLSGVSSSTTLVPNANITFGGSGANRTVTVTPAAGQIGIALITVTVSDGVSSANTSFNVTIQANPPPTITAIATQTGKAGKAIGPVSFTVGDASIPLSSLTLSGVSSATTLVPNANITFGGSGANRTVTVTPAAGQIGTAQITVTVSDGVSNASTSFNATFQANPPPVISTIASQIGTSGHAVGPLSFTVTDSSVPSASLTVSGSSSDTTLVPNANIVFGGSGANRTVKVTPAVGQTGTAQITVTVSDGVTNASTRFNLTVQASPPPTISSIGSQSAATGHAVGPIAFTVADVSVPVASLTLSGVSSAQGLVPNANITFGGSSGNRTVTVTPVAGQTGAAQITVTVSDGVSSANTSFSLTVEANPPPTISEIKDQVAYVGYSTGPIPFTVGDASVPVASLTLSGTSSAQGIVPDANIVFGGSGANRTVNITPAAGQVGSAQITVTVNDGTSTAQTIFMVDVQQPTVLPAATLGKSSTYSGLFYEDDAVRVDSAGAFKLTVTSSGKYSGSVQTGSGTYAFSGQFGVLCQGTNTVVRKGKTPLFLNFNLKSGNSTNQFSGSLSDGVWAAPMHGAMAAFNLKTNPAPYAGSYTLAIPGASTTATVPIGNSFGSLKVDGNGNVKFAGTLADGTKVSQAAPLSKDGLWPFFAPLYKGKGMVIAWISFTNRPADDLHGAINWIKSADPTQHYYSDGLAIQGAVTGSTYAPTSALALSVEVSKLHSSGVGVGNVTALKISSGTGTFAGSVMDQNTGKPVAFQGALLQKCDTGYGFILGSEDSTSMMLTQ